MTSSMENNSCRKFYFSKLWKCWKVSNDDDLIHEDIDRLACQWEICLALLTERLSAMIEVVGIFVLLCATVWIS